MAVLQNAWNAFVTRIQDNTDIKDYFKQWEIDEETEAVDFPYLRIGLDTIELKPIATFGTNITNDAQFNIKVTVMTKHDDETLVTQELLQAIEVLGNAIEGTDITYGDIFQGDLRIIFDDFETLTSDGEKIKKAEGLITITVQPYSGGSL